MKNVASQRESERTTGRTPEIGLDPESWDDLRAHGHRVLDELFDWLRDVRTRPAWQAMPEGSREALRSPLPREGEGLERAWDDFREHVLPYPWGNIHPRFWGWVVGTGSPSGALAELATAVFNVNAGGGNHAGPYLERQVVDWCKEMVGFPAEASGLLVTGGSVANLVGLAAARDAAGTTIPEEGVAAAGRGLVMYASAQTHNSVDKAVRLLGLGQRGLRAIPVDGEHRISLAALEQAVREDRAAGLRPCCVVGNAGTVNTGAIDDLAALADLCARENLWFHVDGAFGALVALSDQLRPLVLGMERADSIAFDLHKWMYMPYDIGCILVRDPVAHQRPFSTHASYLSRLPRGAAPIDRDPGTLGPELSTELRGLKAWLLLKEHGAGKYGQLIEQNVAQAAYLADRVRATPELELMAPVPLNIVCFRYRGDGTAAADLDRVNTELLMRLQERGIAVPSQTMLGGRFALRVAIVNHRSRREDFDLLVDKAVELGREIARGG